MHGLESVWSDRVNFVYLHIDDPDTRPFKSALGYQYQPHIFILDGEGTVLKQWVGYVDAATLEAALREISGQ